VLTLTLFSISLQRDQRCELLFCITPVLSSSGRLVLLQPRESTRKVLGAYFMIMLRFPLVYI